MGIKYDVQYIEYINTAEYHDNLAVEAYLQRCLFDDTIRLSDMRGYNLIGNYLILAFDREMVVSAKSRFNRIEKVFG